MADSLKKSVLCDFVARHSDFSFDTLVTETDGENYDMWNGYCLPMHYSNASDEYDALRGGCAMFDVSPMKKYRFRGADAGAFLDRILTAPVSGLPDMRAAYGLLCNEQGLLLDDGIVVRFCSDDYLLFVSEIDLDAHLASYNDFDDLTIAEETPLLAGLALQGPKSCSVLHHFDFPGIEDLEPFDLKSFDLSGHRVLVGRLGFTGDLGYELWFEPGAIDAVAQAFAKAEDVLGLKVPGYALSALQICRIEAGMIVPGWDTAGEFTDPERERTPYELTLAWNVKLNRAEPFAGKRALEEWKASGPRFTMKGVKTNAKGPLADGDPLYARIDGEVVEVGVLSSVVWHTAENIWIGLASISAEHAKVADVYVRVDGIETDCRFCKLPFIDLQRRSETPAPMQVITNG